VTLSHVDGKQTHIDQTLPGKAPAASVLTREIWVLAVVVVLGSAMTILNATIVKVALPALARICPPRSR